MNNNDMPDFLKDLLDGKMPSREKDIQQTYSEMQMEIDKIKKILEQVSKSDN